jgi:hypothetical protein
MRSQRADDCRARSRKCRAEALRVTDKAIRRQFADLATDWNAMAQDIEQIERMRRMMSEDTARWERLQRSGFWQPAN